MAHTFGMHPGFKDLRSCPARERGGHEFLWLWHSRVVIGYQNSRAKFHKGLCYKTVNTKTIGNELGVSGPGM
jgi:hypothetical protein